MSRFPLAGTVAVVAAILTLVVESLIACEVWGELSRSTTVDRLGMWSKAPPAPRSLFGTGAAVFCFGTILTAGPTWVANQTEGASRALAILAGILILATIAVCVSIAFAENERQHPSERSDYSHTFIHSK
jgi:hypothetical protein